MTIVKYDSDKKQQLGQFMTPLDLSKSILKTYTFKITDKIFFNNDVDKDEWLDRLIVEGKLYYERLILKVSDYYNK